MLNVWCHSLGDTPSREVAIRVLMTSYCFLWCLSWTQFELILIIQDNSGKELSAVFSIRFSSPSFINLNVSAVERDTDWTQSFIFHSQEWSSIHFLIHQDLPSHLATPHDFTNPPPQFLQITCLPQHHPHHHLPPRTITKNKIQVPLFSLTQYAPHADHSLSHQHPPTPLPQATIDSHGPKVLTNPHPKPCAKKQPTPSPATTAPKSSSATTPNTNSPAPTWSTPSHVWWMTVRIARHRRCYGRIPRIGNSGGMGRIIGWFEGWRGEWRREREGRNGERGRERKEGVDDGGMGFQELSLGAVWWRDEAGSGACDDVVSWVIGRGKRSSSLTGHSTYWRAGSTLLLELLDATTAWCFNKDFSRRLWVGILWSVSDTTDEFCCT